MVKPQKGYCKEALVSPSNDELQVSLALVGALLYKIARVLTYPRNCRRRKQRIEQQNLQETINKILKAKVLSP